MLSLSTKLRIYVSLVLSVVLCGSETWTMRKIDNDRVQSFHMQSQRRILGVKWYDKITNAAIKETTELTDLPSLIADPRHSLFVSHLPITQGYTCLTSTASIHRCLYWYTSRCWLEAPTGTSTENLASTGGRGHGSTHQCLSIHDPGPLVVEIATTLSWSSAAVSEWVNMPSYNYCYQSLTITWLLQTSPQCSLLCLTIALST